jgi:hypothetical protein
MKAKTVFPHLARLVDYGDRISKGCKTGANVSIGDGGVLIANDMHSVIILLEHGEFEGEVAFKSHLFPEAESPLLIKNNGKDIDFIWKERSMTKKVNVPSVGNLREGKEGCKQTMEDERNIQASFVGIQRH